MKISPSALLLFPVCLATPLAASISIPLSPVKDAFVSDAAPIANFGGAGALAVSAPGLAKGEFQSLLSFDFSSAKTQLDTAYGPGGWVVESLSIQLTASSPNNANFNASAAGTLAVRWFADDSWIEGTGTPASSNVAGVNFNALAGLLASGTEPLGSIAFTGGTSGNNSISLSLSSGFLADALAGSTASLNLYATDTTASALFSSRSFGTVGNRPVLTLVAAAVPEPSGILMGLPALVLCVIRRR